MDIQKNIPAAEDKKFTGPELDAQAMCASTSLRPAWLELREWGMAGQGDVDVGRSREWGQGLVPAHV